MQPNHFFIEIKNQGNGYALQAGSLESINRFYCKKHYLTQKDMDWDVLWSAFQKAYTQNSREKKADILVYIHGLWGDRRGYFANNLHQSDINYIQNPDSPIAATFTIIWHTPIPHYTYCRKKCAVIAQFFTPHFWSFVEKMQNDLTEMSNSGKIHLLCHSMGNHFLETMLPKAQFEKPIFQEFVMAGADVSTDFFEKHNTQLQRLSNRVIVLNNKKDRLLVISTWLNRKKRLGNTPPQYLNEKYPSVFAVETSHVRDVKTIMGWLHQHAHYHTSERVMLFLSKAFKGQAALKLL